ncbi:hypothetical protein [Streptomyces longisporoflavus]|uniref:PASTA domain-containing protein n=1 Tax=Streptomyces longisporoflavus TaxID=28044 RepID=A0ABW7QIZ0_9ACTN
MRTRTAIITLAAAGVLALTGCAAEDAKSGHTAPETSKTSKAGEAEPDDTPGADSDSDSDADAATETAALPDMTGKGLQAAQDEAQAAGFYALTSSDATGADRMQMFDRSWKVCSQTPQAGKYPTDTTVDFSTVKLTEEC